MRSIFLKIVISSLIVSIISALLYAILQFLPFKFVVAYDVYVFFIILGISLFLAGSITEPLERLRYGFNSLLNGEFVQVEINTKDELEDVGEFFNTVARQLIEREKILRETEEKYRNLVENLKDWIFETDKELNIIFSNMKGNEIIDEEKIIGKNLREFLKDAIDFDEEELNFEAVLINNKIFEFNLNPLYKDGMFSGYIGIGRDITEKKKVEDRIAHLAAITEYTIDAIVSLDIDGNVVSWNKGAEVMFGYKADEVLGKPLFTLVPSELYDECNENFKKAIVEGYTKVETVRIAKDGRKIVVDQTLTSIYNSSGDITGFVTIMRDITEKKKNEIELRKAYEELEKKTMELRYLANLVENSNDAIYSIDMNGIITSWNKTAEKLFGWKKHEAIGMHVNELLPEGFEKETEYIIQKMKDGAKNLSFERKRKCKDGRIIDVEMTISPILDENDNLSGISIIARDTSHKVKSEYELLKRILKYKVEIGGIYLTNNFELAKDVLADMVKAGFNGLILSRRLPEEIDVDCKILWFSEKFGKNAVQPKVKVLERIMLYELPAKNNVVIMELDYLFTKIDFESLFALIQRIKEDFYILRRGVLILVVNYGILNENQLSLLRMECKNLQKKEIKISPELYELLRFVYKKNRIGEKPSIKDTMEELDLARNTVKKRIKQLKNKGLLNVVKYGRTKLLEITDEGKFIFE